MLFAKRKVQGATMASAGGHRRPASSGRLRTAVVVVFFTVLYLSWLRGVAYNAAKDRADAADVVVTTAPTVAATAQPIATTAAAVPTPSATATTQPADGHDTTLSSDDVPRRIPIITVPPIASPRHSTKCPPHGVDIKDTVDNSVQAHPGGTEKEARQFRRDIAKYQWPNVRELDALRWRTLPTSEGGGEDDGPVGGGLGCLLASQHTLPTRAQQQLWHHRAQSEHQCEATNFACRIAAYRTMMPHGTVPHNPMCDRVYGMGLIERLRAADTLLCSSSGTNVHCRMATVHSTHDVETSVCRVDRGAVDFARINHGDYPWLQFETGALPLSCADTADGARVRSAPDRYFLHCLADWMRLGYHSGVGTKDDTAGCEAFVDTPTLFVTRSGDYSPFALTHDWINAVVLMATEALRPEDVQVVVMDRMGVGFYTPVWQVAFAPSHPLQWFPDLHLEDEPGEAAGQRKKKHPPRVCYRKMYFNIPARLSPIYNEDECGAERPGAYTAPLYHVYRDHLLHTFQALHTVGGVAAPDGGPPRLWGTLVVTIIMRRNYATGHSIGRRIANADALTASLRREMSEIQLPRRSGGRRGHDDDGDGAQQQKVHVVVHQTDFAAFDFDQQLNISRATDVLVAMHGAGLAQMMFMHPWGGVFEFFCVEKPSSNYRYHQLANKMGLAYDAYSIANENNEVRIDEAMPQLLRLGQRVAEQKRDALQTAG